ncbi:two-component regulator propeller domain-containing protein [Flavobacterium sp.]|jgi:ligand-binding sensor domain-containing protein|uniref:ligand-binding sensor domain-containing protein n=1 Tax=Flavobacterium sp. TaxID=239 RepID=UPI0037BF7D17
MKITKLISTQSIISCIGLLFLSAFEGQSQNLNTNKVIQKADLLIENKPENTIDKNIRSVFQDRNGNYWIGTNGADVYRYDGKTITLFTTKDGLADNQVISIQEDGDGNLWFESSSFAISKFDGKKCSILSDTIHVTNGTNIEWQSKKSDLWFYGGSGVFNYCANSIDYLPFIPRSSIKQIIQPFSLSRYSVYCILKDSNGNVWFGTQAEGICKFDGNSLTWFKEKGLAGPAVLGIFEDSKHNLWFGNNGGGLFQYDGKNLRNLTEEKGLSNPDFRTTGTSNSTSLARVYCINEDRSGNIWIGTVDAGVWKYDGINLTNYGMKDGLTSDAVNTIYKDKSGELWFGTDSNGIYKFNGTTFTECNWQ